MLEISQSNHYNVFVVSGNSAPTLSFLVEIHLAHVGLSSVKLEKGGGLLHMHKAVPCFYCKIFM